jgi:acetate kinase
MPVAMTPFILVANAGSSSLKFALFRKTDANEPVAEAAGEVEGIGTQPRFTVRNAVGETVVDRSHKVDEVLHHAGAIAVIGSWLKQHYGNGELLAIGHRVVHGGQHFSEPVLVDTTVLTELEALVPLAPLHQPHSIALIRAVQHAMPAVPQIACFDAAFHTRQPAVAKTFAVPQRLTLEGVRRYGFHGLSYEYIASALPALSAELSAARVVVAHLGNGASMCAMRAGRSVATTMSFTALDGLVMGTRCGDLDPAVLLYLMDRHGMDARALEKLLYHESGLLGVSGISSDMRTLLASNEPSAKEAIELFVYRIGRELGSVVAALGGLDALVFTAGIGERSAVVRAQICRHAAWLGLELDEAANERHGPCLSKPGSKVSAWMLPTNEDLVIARHTIKRVQR